jgi:hypothetical protein
MSALLARFKKRNRIGAADPTSQATALPNHQSAQTPPDIWEKIDGGILCTVCRQSIAIGTSCKRDRHVKTDRHQQALRLQLRERQSPSAPLVDNCATMESSISEDDVDVKSSFDFEDVDCDVNIMDIEDGSVEPSSWPDPTGSDNEWAPYGTRAMFYAACLMYNNKIPISKTALEHVWYVCSQLGVPLPPMSAVAKRHMMVCSSLGGAPQRFTSPLGTIYYVNEITAMIAREVGNPIVMKELALFGEDTGKQLSEMNNAMRWLDDPLMSAIMIQIPTKPDLFLGECFRIESSDYQVGGFVIKNSVLHVLSDPVPTCPAADGKLSSLPQHRKLIPSTFFNGDIVARNVEIANLTDPYADVRTRLKTASGGRRILSVPVVLQCDDMSGNRSKRWNKHMSWLAQLGGLKFNERTREFNMHFVSTSNIAGGLEMGAGVLDAFTREQPGTVAFDAVRREEVYVVPRLLVLLGDNPMSAEFVSMMPSGKAHAFCRKCEIAGKVSIRTFWMH